MAIYTQNIGKVVEGEPVTWTGDQALLYALSIGVGRPDSTDRIAYTTENSAGIEQRAFPTFAVVLGGSSGSLADLGDFRLHQILHGGQSLTLHQELQPAGTATPRHFMSAVYDQGQNAIIELTTELVDPAGQLMATSITSMVIRGENGYGPRPPIALGWVDRQEPADKIVQSPTSTDQALLYRLNGDKNPLHSDPAMAQKIGFERPILHGLCTYAMAAEALLRSVDQLAEKGLGSISARFAAPVIPGQTLTTHIWNTTEGANFQVLCEGKVVLDRGVAIAIGNRAASTTPALDNAKV
ncbi:MaoC/PaaZ C-terminal domain-containing protein [Arthrobacter sp. MYb213]|uniref:MaoC/PaaZ C-terminal domain-containing protein n=1 Tax=Arthrobacter sp. MYb213 TaxID=1848595 RepID=UPI000CFD5652|nr:MaoC/PaaZ C-terminal domain-containing protein [Arthrobacter sp. MYb213]PRB70411.1 hypothetical protein CQ011_09690 [Arthrobacter sp. MYb213]